MHDIKITFEKTRIPMWSKYIIPVTGSCELHIFKIFKTLCI